MLLPRTPSMSDECKYRLTSPFELSKYSVEPVSAKTLRCPLKRKSFGIKQDLRTVLTIALEAISFREYTWILEYFS
jgi:hypothetical protein